MSERDEKQAKLLNIQIFVLFFSILSIILSILTTYNQKLATEKKNVLFEPEKARDITLFNRILITSIAIIFLYINYRQYKIDKNYNDNNSVKNDQLQIIASLFTIASALIALYVVYKSTTETVADVENPVI